MPAGNGESPSAALHARELTSSISVGWFVSGGGRSSVVPDAALPAATRDRSTLSRARMDSLRRTSFFLPASVAVPFFSMNDLLTTFIHQLVVRLIRGISAAELLHSFERRATMPGSPVRAVST